MRPARHASPDALATGPRAPDRGKPVPAAGAFRLALSGRTVLRWHAGAVAALVLLHILLQSVRLLTEGGPVVKLSELFDLNRERNLPTTFQAAALWGSAVLLLAVARCRAGSRQARRWLFLAIGFAYLSFDELAELHERGNGVLAILTGSEKTFAGWLVLFIPIAAACLAYLAPLLRSVPPRIGAGLAVAAALYLCGSIGMEIVSLLLVRAGGDQSMPLLVFATIEETLEMAAVVLLVQVLLTYLRQQDAALMVVVRE